MHLRIAKNTCNRTGFTLVELAIVLVVIGLVTAMGMVATLGAIENARRASTENRMDAIEKALMDFRNKYDRLPCPADSSVTTTNALVGAEKRLGTACDLSSPSRVPFLYTEASTSTTYAEGGVPTKTLGLPDEFLFDGWGRPFMYSIPPTAGEDQAFNWFIRAQDNQCAGMIIDQSGSVRSNGPIYVLTSFGLNGHGAFLHDGTQFRVNAGITNPLELKNCHCDVTGELDSDYVNGVNEIQWVQGTAVDSTAGVASVFDDIVRFKERWQMQNDEDYRKSADYKDYNLAVTYNGFGDGSSYLYKFNGCTRDWEAHPTTTVTPDNIVMTGSSLFFEGNTLFFYTDSTSNPIQPYYINRNNISASTCSPITNCVATVPLVTAPASSTSNAVAVSNNHYVALGYGVTPFVQVYKAANTNSVAPVLAPVVTPFSATVPAALLAAPGASYGQPTTVFPLPSANTPTAAPKIIALSKNADYMFLSDSDGVGGGTYADMYVRVGGSTFKKLHSDFQPIANPTVINPITIGSATFSPDGKYFVLGISGASAVKVWRLRPGTPFLAIASAGVDPLVTVAANISFPGNVAPMVAFSPDSTYFVAAGGTGVAGAINTAGNIYLYKIEINDVFNNITSSITGDYASGGYSTAETPIPGVPILFTPNSSQFIIATAHADPGDGTTWNMLSFQKASTNVWGLKVSAAPPFKSVPFLKMAITPP